MRILAYCDEDLSVAGGGARQVLELGRALAARGHAIRLVAQRPEGRAETTGWPIVTVPVVRGPGLRPLSYLLASGWVLRREIVQWRPDALLWFDSPGQVAPLWATSATGCPYVWFVNGLPREEVRGVWAWPPVVNLLQWGARRAAQEARIVVGVCEELLDYAIRRWGVPRARCRLIRNGVDASAFRPQPVQEARKALGLHPDGPVIGFVGGFFPWHGLDLLVHAMPRVREAVPQALCLCVGDGPMRPAIEALATRLGMTSAIRFPGRVAADAVPLWIAACDVAVVLHRATRSYPGDSMKLWEYLACGRPVVATAGPGYGDVVRQAGCGVVAMPEDAGDLARCLTGLLRDPETRIKMGERARTSVVTAHTWAARAVELEHALRAAAAEPKSDDGGGALA